MYLLAILDIPLLGDFMPAVVSRATSLQRIAILCVIVDAGADVYVGEDTTLHVAMMTLEQEMCLEVVKTPVGAGCKPFTYKAGKTPLQLASERRYQYLSVADYLLLQQSRAPPDVQ